jgi:hypothetical protein
MNTRATVVTVGFSLALASAALLASTVVPGPVPGTFIGPTSSQSPYVIPTSPGWEVTSLLTVGDSPQENFYPMVGIPDGLGAIAGPWNDDTGKYVADKAFMTVFMNHELETACIHNCAIMQACRSSSQFGACRMR